ncbi:serine/threonine-protein kinase Nek8-like isoform X1 [Biomphalaria glabrata]|uniref:Serine/threonine-protein kinase Nek8 n=2 Tax=Biomphalaria glabrata TaxID=6526 RepID=A0A9U8EEY4_BIOGL|nr:serine/threonine-protein kinase Nek8-like isoform X1 [Biomphalaria glabrata]XP_013083909.2 serine/threonine-protein kinase Nek8-like isoform X1 [Biomphalaria glabrata]XP_013083910.2 serine/threonine-protein kinase Nek8-like isoform X1 [Biomphalaria glabrata]XP_055886374.1 serine/threonine-protein kinase Nek8-like isoform X1 [Biomphalaria glabrata]XP_055886375.1 serine/threonine-protein kinase Nek8-like isoform X1 [Biomphalaria glabrata]XP_055886376.1 serine/threonine-protein kinase Nek8-lik
MEKYEKIGVVGRGAYGTVHLCVHLSDRKNVIIKQIPVEQMTKDERQAALNEVKVLSMLHHPNIIQYYENFLEDKALMIVMEYAEGGTLLDFLQSRNGCLLEEEEILKFLAQMLLSLQHVHSKQILHRDLKTQNILLDKKKEIVKIGDFGISKVLSSKSKAYTVVGTPCYISPELCEGKPYNQKSDIWALGCVLYELASLKRAFEAANLPALILKIMRGTFSPISSRYSSHLRDLILSMLHLDPTKRPTINQIMAQPIIINTIMNLHTDMGKVPCVRINWPLTNIQGTGRGRLSIKGNITSQENLSSTPQPLSSVFCWGGGMNTPTKLSLPNMETQVVQVAIGRTQRAAVTKNGRLFVWEPQTLGTDSLMPGSTYSAPPIFIPRFLEGQTAVTIQHVACGDLFTACLTDRGILMTFGSGANGCLGHGNCNDVTQAKIVEALLGYEVIQVSCGASHVLAVTNEHEVFAWGRGDNGRLGLGSYESTTSPKEILIPEDAHPCSVHCGMDCSVLLTLEHKLLCSGSNRCNKLALDKAEDNIDGVIEETTSFTPVASVPVSSLYIKMVALGTSHSAVITVDGECYTFGSNQFGQLGVETETGNRKPKLVSSLQDKIVFISCGDIFTVAVSEDNKVYTWGKSSRGRLGRSLEDSHLPRPVVFPKDEEFFEVLSVSSCHGSTVIATRPKPNYSNPV